MCHMNAVSTSRPQGGRPFVLNYRTDPTFGGTNSGTNYHQKYSRVLISFHFYLLLITYRTGTGLGLSRCLGLGAFIRPLTVLIYTHSSCEGRTDVAGRVRWPVGSAGR